MFTGYLIDLCHGYYSLPWYHYLIDPKKKLEVVENDQTPHIKRENTATKIKQITHQYLSKNWILSFISVSLART